MWHVVILLLGAHLACARTHSLRYFFTGVSGDIDFPEFTAVGLVDEGQFFYFDSNTKKTEPKTEWIRQNEGEDYWNSQTQILIDTHQSYKVGIQIIKELFNQSGGVHTWQMMCGCELDEDGTKQGYMQYGYDGEDFLSFDKSTLTWTAANPQAVITKHKWDSTGEDAIYWKGYLDNTCIEWLQKYVIYGENTTKVAPQVSLLQKSSSSSVKCHATGFYPSGVTISWQKNGQEHHEDVYLAELLPNEDGTFQRTSTIKVSPEELKKNQFSCVVEHQGETFRSILMDDKIKTNYASVPIGFILAAVAGVFLLIVTAVAGYTVYQKKKGFKPVNASDDGSNGSNPSAVRMQSMCVSYDVQKQHRLILIVLSHKTHLQSAIQYVNDRCTSTDATLLERTDGPQPRERWNPLTWVYKITQKAYALQTEYV
ncbi:major histocompatibility complex class I-related gene protein isoform X4 [Carassius gibelio]|uniref:major histocompatibility complex class I-related gene protein isoform X4 n=1 Tax=Carassius gibelio TaxID=101364 RepID=UPI002277FD42|nr:major histocompatibility complex class I-related gene protein isoform X4 [Carassius gibelio]